MTAQTTEMWIYDQLKSALSAKKKKKNLQKKTFKNRFWKNVPVTGQIWEKCHFELNLVRSKKIKTQNSVFNETTSPDPAFNTLYSLLNTAHCNKVIYTFKSPFRQITSLQMSWWTRRRN